MGIEAASKHLDDHIEKGVRGIDESSSRAVRSVKNLSPSSFLFFKLKFFFRVHYNTFILKIKNLKIKGIIKIL